MKLIFKDINFWNLTFSRIRIQPLLGTRPSLPNFNNKTNIESGKIIAKQYVGVLMHLFLRIQWHYLLVKFINNIQKVIKINFNIKYFFSFVISSIFLAFYDNFITTCAEKFLI